jgi:polysaccharide biosynthesis/export protein VpsN
MKVIWAGIGTALVALLIGCAPVPVTKTPAAPAAPVAPGPVPVMPGAAGPALLNTETYRLAPGDVVRIDVLAEPDLSLQALVDPTGSINYPFLGRVPAAGLTTRMLEQKIYAGLKSGYLVNPDVRVAIAQYRPVYVSGQVRQSGAYPFTTGLTVEKVLTLAGGITQFGSTRRIYIQRANAAPDQREQAEMSTAVLPGDTVVVQERLF